MYHTNGMQTRRDIASASRLEWTENSIHIDLQDQSKSNHDVWVQGNDPNAKTGTRFELLAWEGPQLTEAWRQVWRRSSEEIHRCSEEAMESVDLSEKDSCNPASVSADDWLWQFERAAARRKSRGWSIWHLVNSKHHLPPQAGFLPLRP